MGKFKDLTGQKFGKLTVAERAGSQGNHPTWYCQCDCGNVCTVRGDHLKNWTVKSCSCLNIENIIKHGKARDRIYKIFANIKSRCFNPNNKAYKNYGGRGITMYPAWVNDFQAFYDYVSKLPHFGEAGYSLDRINNDGNYEPDNVRWATAEEQGRNKRTNHLIEYQGKQVTIKEASELSKVNKNTLLKRVRHGDTGEYLFRLPKK